MRRAVEDLEKRFGAVDFVLADGLAVREIAWPWPYEALVKGDARSFSIAAASIRGQSRARRNDDRVRRAVSRLRIRRSQRLPDARALGGSTRTGRVRDSSPHLCARCAQLRKALRAYPERDVTSQQRG